MQILYTGFQLFPPDRFVEQRRGGKAGIGREEGRAGLRSFSPDLSESESHSAAAVKSLQSCPTLCDPIDGSPPGSPLPGILQARTLEWVAISFFNA